MERLHVQILVCALMAVQQASTHPAPAAPQSVSKQPNQKVRASAAKLKMSIKEQPKAKSPRTDAQFIERAIKTHVPAPGQFLKRRQRIWESLKRNYAQKKDITEVLRQYVDVNDSVVRGTNWVMDDAGTYTRKRPLSLQCKELEDSLQLSPFTAPIK